MVEGQLVENGGPRYSEKGQCLPWFVAGTHHSTTFSSRLAGKAVRRLLGCSVDDPRASRNVEKEGARSSKVESILLYGVEG